mgnify:FL=1
MARMDQWLALDPLDTLFFRGSEPMIAGEGHEVGTLFTPLPETCLGALCTAILKQQGIKPSDYAGAHGPTTALRERFPLLGEPGNPGFQILGPLFCWQTPASGPNWFYPAPAHWFADLDGLSEDKPALVTIAVADELPPKFSELGLVGSVTSPAWVLSPPSDNLMTLAGHWINHLALENFSPKGGSLQYCPQLSGADPSKPLLIPLNALFGREIRTGIAIDYGLRRVKKGHLYTSTQVRLQPGVLLILGFSPALVPDYLDPEGVFQLGGEQRRVSYALLKDGPPLTQGSSSWLMSLMPFPCDSLGLYGWQDRLRFSGPLIRLAGWDMKTKFHKPTRAFFPAGTVIKAKPEDPVPFGFIRLS